MRGNISHSLPARGDLSAEVDEFRVRATLDFILHFWRFLLTVSLICATVVYVLLQFVPPRYTATAQVLLEPRREKIFGTENILPELNLENPNIESQVLVIQSTNLLRRVVESQNLVADPEFGDGAQGGILSFVKKLLTWGAREEPAEDAGDVVPPKTLNAIENLRDAMTVERVSKTFVLAISLRSKNAAKSARLANAIANMYVIDRLDSRYDAAKRASAWLSERLEVLRDQVRRSEEAVAKFRQDNNLFATSSEDKVSVTEQQLSELNTKLIATRAETSEARAKYELATQVVAQRGNIEALPDVVRSNVISELRKQQAEVARREAELVAHYGDNHPLAVNARAERRDIERSISAEVRRILVNLKNDYAVAQAREESVQGSLAKVTKQSGVDNSVGVRLRELERINTANKTLFDNLLSRTKMAQEQSNLEEREARVISPAAKPERPSSPKKTLWAAMAGALGLLGASAFVTSRKLLVPGFTTAREVEEKIDAQVLASIPLLSKKDLTIDGKHVHPARYLIAKPSSAFSESIRAIRMGVEFADERHPVRVVTITSSRPQEGKSTIAISLAYSASMAGRKVLIIDGDRFNPTVSRFFNIAGDPGLTDFLTDRCKFADALSRVGGVTILPVGAQPAAAADVLGSSKFRHAVETAQAMFDFVVIDAPPLGSTIDARVLATYAEMAIFVVRWKETDRNVVEQNLDFLTGAGRRAGVVLNLVDAGEAAHYGSSATAPADQLLTYCQT